jgi:hypothetical protein
VSRSGDRSELSEQAVADLVVAVERSVEIVGVEELEAAQALAVVERHPDQRPGVVADAEVVACDGGSGAEPRFESRMVLRGVGTLPAAV